MKQRTKLVIAISILLIAISLIVGLIIMSANKISNIELPTYLISTTPEKYDKVEETPLITTPRITNELNPSNEPIPTSDSTPSTKPTSTPYIQPNNSQTIAKITIETDRKTRTYDIMPDVDENTLKKNLGHLPTSAMFGEEGLCVIMGHRDTQFSILKYCEIGDSITILSNQNFYVYTVYDIQIVENDSTLKFSAYNNSNIALISCYPFYYTGHAPNKIIVFGALT